jgi:hypothetical protein
MSTKVMVIDGDETGMVGEIILVENSDVTIKVLADANALYTFKFGKLRVIEDEGLDKFYDELIEPEILRHLEEEDKLDWDNMAEAELIFDLMEKGLK